MYDWRFYSELCNFSQKLDWRVSHSFWIVKLMSACIFFSSVQTQYLLKHFYCSDLLLWQMPSYTFVPPVSLFTGWGVSEYSLTNSDRREILWHLWVVKMDMAAYEKFYFQAFYPLSAFSTSARFVRSNGPDHLSKGENFEFSKVCGNILAFMEIMFSTHMGGPYQLFDYVTLFLVC